MVYDSLVWTISDELVSCVTSQLHQALVEQGLSGWCSVNRSRN